MAQAAQRSVFSIYQETGANAGTGSSGVAVYRYRPAAGASTSSVLIAMAAHTINKSMGFFVIDADLKKYTNVDLVLHDRAYDIAIARVKDVPLSMPIATIQHSSKVVENGLPVYVVGWPEMMDFNSVSRGCVRSGAWGINGAVPQILFDAPIFGGNSGGGVFRADNNELIGLVSWLYSLSSGTVNQETLNGAVPASYASEALLRVLKELPLGTSPALATPLEHYSRNTFSMGITTQEYRFSWVNDTNVPNVPVLRQYGHLGVSVVSVPADVGHHLGRGARRQPRQRDQHVQVDRHHPEQAPGRRHPGARHGRALERY
jgi:S1-C subfamily serine protease